MATSTTPPPSGPEPDFGVETPDDIKALATAAENDVLLQHLLGIDLPANLDAPGVANLLATRIATRIAGNVDVTRHGMTQAGLQGVLNTNINAALQRVRPITSRVHPSRAVTDPLRHQQIRAITEAIRESVPQTVLIDHVRYGLPAVIHESPNVPDHHMLFKCDIGDLSKGIAITRRKVLVDTRHEFWREQKFTAQLDLENALRSNRRVSSVGISIPGAPPVPEDYELTDVDIANILASTANTLDLGKRYEDIRTTVLVGGANVQFTVNTANLVKYRLPSGALIASVNRPGLATALQDPNVWTTFISSEPPVAAPIPVVCNNLAFAIWGRLNGAAPSGHLALQSQTLFDVHRQVSEQHRFFKRVREGSDNYAAAAFATTILMRYKDLRSVIDTRDAATIQAEIDALQNQIYVHDELKKLSALSVKLSTASVTTYQDAVDEDAHLRADRAIVTTPGAAWSSQYMGTYPMTPPLTGANATNAVSAIQAAVIENQKIVREYEGIGRQLVLLKQRCDLAGLTSPRLDTFFTPPPNLNRATVDKDFDPTIIASEIESQLKTGGTKLLSRTDIDEQIKIKEGEKSKVGKTGLHGDEAQHKVIKEYLIKYHGRTESEANAGANYIRSRSYLDAELSQRAEEVAEELYGGEVGRVTRIKNWFENLKNLSFTPERRAQTVIVNVAVGCNIPLSSGVGRNIASNRVPQWRQAKSYEDLSIAYFALKKLKSGEGVPSQIALQETLTLQNHMREIAKCLMSRHAEALVRDLGPGTGVTDEKMKAIIREPKKPEHVQLLKRMLDGNPSEKYSKRIQKAIDTANRRTHWVRRNLLLGENYGLVTGKKLPISAKGLLYGNKYVSGLGALKGAGWVGGKALGVGKAVAIDAPLAVAKGVGRGVKAVTYDAPKAVVKEAWRNKGTVAAATAATFFFGPVGLAAVGAYYLMNRKAA